MKTVMWSLATVALSVAIAQPVAAQSAATPAPQAKCDKSVCVTPYDPSFFAAYAPITALDMVNNLPGFTIRNGDRDTRGFDATTGNVLINGKRASSKSESASDQLSIIPADDVLTIELLQGQLSSYDLIGQTIAVNIIRKSLGATGTLTVSGRILQPSSAIRPRVEWSYSSRIGNTDYTTSLEVSRYQFRTDSIETVSDRRGQVVEIRDETFDETGDRFAAVFNTSTQINDIRLNTNLAVETSDESGGEISQRTPLNGRTPSVLGQPDTDNWFDYEVGFDVQKPITDTLTAKVITLLVSSDYRETGALDETLPSQPELRTSEFFFNSLSTEKILRFEFDYSGIDQHLFELSVEGAINTLESAFAFSTLSNGELTPVDVPGADTKVEEKRVDARITDSVKFGNLGVEAALGAEHSTLSQEGGFNADRSFFFIKPSLSLSYAIDKQKQVQVRLVREIGQLDFFDFTSATDLGDVELELGNPELEPEKTTTFDVRYEQRSTGVDAVTATVFYNWIEDVADIVPVSEGLEVPGNIGRGYRFGARSDITLALDRIGLSNGRLDANLRWQRSAVDDPLTGQSRPLSWEEGWDVRVNVRQDLESLNLAWGATYFVDANIPLFGLDERIAFDADRGFNLFVEKRDWFGFRARLSVDNLFRGGIPRDRLVFSGPRNNSSLAFREFRDTTFTRRIALTLSRTF